MGQSTVIDTATDDQRQQFEEHGFVIVRGAADDHQIQAAAAAIDRILDRAVAGEFGDRFRWTDEARRVPSFLGDLLSPSKYDPALADLLESVMIPFTESLLEKEVRFSWMLMLTGGADQPYSLALHRDNSELGSATESHLRQLYQSNGCYFQAPILSSDRFLQVVPGSHRRQANEIEVAAARRIEASPDVPNLVTIELQPGDIVYRETNLIHQGWNPKGLPRWTLVSTMWAADLPLQPIELHNYDRINVPGFIQSLPPRCRRAATRYLDAYEKSQAAAG